MSDWEFDDDWSNDDGDGEWGDADEFSVSGDPRTQSSVLQQKTQDCIAHDLIEIQNIQGFTASDAIYRENSVIVFTLGLNISSLELSKEQLLARGVTDCSVITITFEFDGSYFEENRISMAVLLDNEPFKLSWPILDRLKRTWLPACIGVPIPERPYDMGRVMMVKEAAECTLSQAISAVQKYKENYEAITKSTKEPVQELDFPHNHLYTIMKEVKSYLLNLHMRCLICDEQLSYVGFKPGVCNKDLCGYGYETFGLGIDLAGEITNHPDVLDLQISLLVAAKRLSFLELKIEERVVNGDEMVAVLKEHCPSVDEMMQLIRDGKNLKVELLQLHKDLYPILRWIITSNKSYIRPLDGTERLHEMKTPYQFMMVADSPEKEQRFQELKCGPGGLKAVWKQSIEAVIGAKDKSFYAFHGSSIGNWFTILRTGLKNLSNTKHMTNGAAHGAGIYLAGTSGTSIGYCKYGTIWEKSRFGESIQCIALCEVVGISKKKYSDIYVVPDEEKVVTRYVFVYPKGQRIPSLSANNLHFAG